jgi:hypothetical protein
VSTSSTIIKSFAASVLLSIVSFSLSAQRLPAEEIPDSISYRIIKSNLIGLLSENYNITYEKNLRRPKNSFNMLVAYSILHDDDFDFRGFDLEPGLRTYYSAIRKNKYPPHGWYLQVTGFYLNYSYTNKDTNARGRIRAYGPGLLVGYQWILPNGISIETFVGAAYLFTELTGTYNNPRGKLEGVVPTFGFNAGYRFKK